MGPNVRTRPRTLNSLQREDGFALVVGMLMLVLVAFLGIAAINSSDTEVTIAGNEVHRTQAFYFAEAGSELAIAEIFESYSKRGVPPAKLPANEVRTSDGILSYQTADLGPASIENLESGAYAGLYGLVKSYAIKSVGRVPNEPDQVEIVQVVQDALVPIFQFAVFYEEDLEFHPGPRMTIGGRMHTNGDMYLGADNELRIDSYVTAAGNIFASRKPGSELTHGSGNVLIKDADGNYQGMEQGGDWLDSRDSNWVSESIARWDGQVEDGNHGMTELQLPVVVDGPSTDLIDPDAGGTNPDSYENKADLKIIDGQAYYNNSGSWVNVTAPLTTSGALGSKTFYDDRENKWVTTTEVDVQKLGSTSYYPKNGIIYSAHAQSGGNLEALRLVNGGELPSDLTVASPNPVYTVGDYNVTNKKAAAIMADAYTILSNNWDDGLSNSNAGSRIADDTKVQVAFMTGNTETGKNGKKYNGGLENLPRLLENWSGKTLTLRGSFVDLWKSRQAQGGWDMTYYSPPDRDWAFDKDFLDPNNLPPGTPRVNVTQKVAWRQNFAVTP